MGKTSSLPVPLDFLQIHGTRKHCECGLSPISVSGRLFKQDVFDFALLDILLETPLGSFVSLCSQMLAFIPKSGTFRSVHIRSTQA